MSQFSSMFTPSSLPSLSRIGQSIVKHCETETFPALGSTSQHHTLAIEADRFTIAHVEFAARIPRAGQTGQYIFLYIGFLTFSVHKKFSLQDQNLMNPNLLESGCRQDYCRTLCQLCHLFRSKYQVISIRLRDVNARSLSPSFQTIRKCIILSIHKEILWMSGAIAPFVPSLPATASNQGVSSSVHATVSTPPSVHVLPSFQYVAQPVHFIVITPCNPKWLNNENKIRNSRL